MIYFAIGWYVSGLISWYLFLFAEGKITRGDIMTGFMMALTGIMLPAALCVWYLFWYYAAWCDKVVWKREN